MTIQVFSVDEGLKVDNGSGTTVWDVDNTGAMTVAATSRLTGIVTMGTAGNTYAFPAVDGAANTVLTTDGAGTLTFTDPGAGYVWNMTDGSTSQAVADTESVTFTAGTAITAVLGGTRELTITNTGVTSAVAGTAISVSAATGAVTFTNTGVTSLAATTPANVSAATGGITISIDAYSGTTGIGYVPTGGSATTFLRGDGTWADPGSQYEWTLAGSTGSETIADTTTVTLGGGTTGLTYAVAAGVSVTTAGTLAVGHGGTGQTTYTNGQLLIGNTTGNTLAKATLTAGTGITITNGTGTIEIANSSPGGSTTFDIAGDTGAGSTISDGDTLTVTAGSTGLSFAAATDTITLSGTLAIANGGTGQTSKTAAFDALAPTTTKADIIVYDGSDNLRLAVGSDGDALFADSTTATGLKWDAVSASAGGNTTEVQFNNGGILAGNSNWTFITGTSVMSLTGQMNVDNLRFDANTISTTTAGGITLDPSGGGGLVFDYATWPATDAASSGFVLSSNAAGTLSWISNDAADSAGAQYDIQFSDGAGGFDADTTNEFQYNDTTTSATATGEFILGKSRRRTIQTTAALSATTTIETFAGATYGTADYTLSWTDPASGQWGITKFTIATNATVVVNQTWAVTTSDGNPAIVRPAVTIGGGTVTVSAVNSSGSACACVTTRTLFEV